MRLWTVLALALAIGAGTAQGADKEKKGKKDKPKPTAEQVFSKIDTNGDGKLTKEEFTARAKDKSKAEQRFDKLAKGQSSVSKADFIAAHERHAKKAEKAPKGDKAPKGNKKPEAKTCPAGCPSTGAKK